MKWSVFPVSCLFFSLDSYTHTQSCHYKLKMIRCSSKKNDSNASTTAGCVLVPPRPHAEQSSHRRWANAAGDKYCPDAALVPARRDSDGSCAASSSREQSSDVAMPSLVDRSEFMNKIWLDFDIDTAANATSARQKKPATTVSLSIATPRLTAGCRIIHDGRPISAVHEKKVSNLDFSRESHDASSVVNGKTKKRCSEEAALLLLVALRVNQHTVV